MTLIAQYRHGQGSAASNENFGELTAAAKRAEVVAGGTGVEDISALTGGYEAEYDGWGGYDGCADGYTG